MPTQAPWWGGYVIAGGFLIIGGLLTFLYTAVNEWRKTRIEDKVRHIAVLREALSDVLDAVRIMDKNYLYWDLTLPEKETITAALNGQHERIAELKSVVELLAGRPKLIEAIGALQFAAYRYANNADNPRATDEVEKKQLMSDRDKAKATFLREAQSAIRVK